MQRVGQPIRIRFLLRDWKYIFEAVRDGEVDMAISTITILPEREKRYNARF